MAPKSQPPGFEGSREVTPEDLESLPAITQDAVHTLERCIAEHHIAEVDYKEPEEREETIRLRPARPISPALRPYSGRSLVNTTLSSSSITSP